MRCAALHDVEIGHADGAADRVAGIGEAVHDRPVFRRGVLQHIPDLVRDHRGRDREIGAGDALGQGHDIGLELVEPGGEPRAGAPEPGDHLVGDEEDVVLGEDCLNLLEVALGRQEDAAGAHDRLGDEGGDGIGALALDHLLEIADHAVGEGDLVLARLAVTVEMRAGGVEDALDRQIECLMVGGDAGHARGGIGQAVIATQARDDLLLLRPPKKIVVVADELEVGVVGVGPRSAEEYL